MDELGQIIGPKRKMDVEALLLPCTAVPAYHAPSTSPADTIIFHLALLHPIHLVLPSQMLLLRPSRFGHLKSLLAQAAVGIITLVLSTVWISHEQQSTSNREGADQGAWTASSYAKIAAVTLFGGLLAGEPYSFWSYCK